MRPVRVCRDAHRALDAELLELDARAGAGAAGAVHGRIADDLCRTPGPLAYMHFILLGLLLVVFMVGSVPYDVGPIECILVLLVLLVLLHSSGYSSGHWVPHSGHAAVFLHLLL